jgi:hypothetical protein
LVSADKGYTPLNLSDNIISDIVKPNIPDTIANIKQKSLHGRYFKELEQPEVNMPLMHIHPETGGFIFAIQNRVFFFFFCFAAEMACKRKHSKYSSIISSNYVFKGLAFETLGPWCKEAIDFINVIGNRLIAESGDSKSKKFIFERISLAIQRGNAASIRGTFPDSAILSEIFVL